jgi:hypothetical protein
VASFRRRREAYRAVPHLMRPVLPLPQVAPRPVLLQVLLRPAPLRRLPLRPRRKRRRRCCLVTWRRCVRSDRTGSDLFGISRTNGEPSLGLNVVKETNVNTVKVAADVEKVLDDVREEIGRDQIVVVLNSATDVEESVNGLVEEALVGAVLAILVIFAFLRSLRATLVTAVSLPTSVLVALLFSWTDNLTLNIITLAGLTIAVGRVVDDAIRGAGELLPLRAKRLRAGAGRAQENDGDRERHHLIDAHNNGRLPPARPRRRHRLQVLRPALHYRGPGLLFASLIVAVTITRFSSASLSGAALRTARRRIRTRIPARLPRTGGGSAVWPLRDRCCRVVLRVGDRARRRLVGRGSR